MVGDFQDHTAQDFEDCSRIWIYTGLGALEESLAFTTSGKVVEVLAVVSFGLHLKREC